MRFLREKMSEDFIKENIFSLDEFNIYPKIADRKFWDALDHSVRQQLIEKGEEFLEFVWKSVPATTYLEFYRSGNRIINENLLFEKRMALGSLIVAECAENKGRFMDSIIDGIWSICEETTWSVSAHVNQRESSKLLPDVYHDKVIDLFATETAQLLAFAYYLMKEKLDNITPLISDRIKREITARIIDAYLAQDDNWWMGFSGRVVNNWNPWCNGNVMWACMLVTDDISKRAQVVNKVIDSMDIFINEYKDDGGCNEGRMYWFHAGAALMDALEVLYHATGRLVNVFKEQKIINIGRYISTMRITGGHYLNFADSNAVGILCPSCIYRYGRNTGDDVLMSEGAYLYKLDGYRVSYEAWHATGRVICELMVRNEILQYEKQPTCEKDLWCESLGIMIAREKQNYEEGLYLAAKGGSNAESHNHNDVGSVIIYKDGRPILIDVGVGTYTHKTFSARRFEIWTMQSAYHNLPQINGHMQMDGVEYISTNVVYDVCDDVSTLSMDLDKVYKEAAGIDRWRRSSSLDRKNLRIVIQDTFNLKQESEIKMSLMTVIKPEIIGENVLRVGNATLNISGVNGKLLIEDIKLDDPKIKASWGESVYRIIFSFKQKEGSISLVIS